MKVEALSRLELPPTADFHSHLRQGEMMNMCVSHVKNGGSNVAYIMPNTKPPITSISQAVAYHKELSHLAPGVNFMMTLFLHPNLNADLIRDAAQTGIIHGVKLYPAGVTTNSQDGILDIEQFYPVFAALEGADMVLNIHGEMQNSLPSTATAVGEREAVSVLNAEPMFVKENLIKIHRAFPRLRIVLEHVSTREGLEAVRKCGPTVAATITAHHLWLTVDDWCHDVHSFCKPVAKTAGDRIALVRAVAEGSPKFFFGSDSAPHPIEAKKGPGDTAAGCFTQGWTTALVVGALEEGVIHGWIKEEDLTVEAIEGFLSGHGRAFYKLPPSSESSSARIKLEKNGETIPEVIRSQDGNIEVVPFRRGNEVLSVSWQS